MMFTLPTHLQQAPKALQGVWRRASPAGGEVGEAANTLAQRMRDQRAVQRRSA